MFACRYAGQIIMVGLMQIKVQATWRLMATRLISLVPCLTLAVVFEATNTFDQVSREWRVFCLPPLKGKVEERRHRASFHPRVRPSAGHVAAGLAGALPCAGGGV